MAKIGVWDFRWGAAFAPVMVRDLHVLGVGGTVRARVNINGRSQPQCAG